MSQEQNMNLNINPEEVVCDWMSSEAHVPVNKATAHKIGLDPAFLLAEIVNQYKRWKAQGKLNEEGEFFWSEKDCESETTFSKSKQSRVFSKLEELDLLHRVSRKNPLYQNKTARFIKLNFSNVARMMFENDSNFREVVSEKYKLIRARDEQHKKLWVLKQKSQSETSGKSQSETSRKSQNETISKKLSSFSNKLNSSNKNQSINESLIEKMDVPVQLQKELIQKIDRLIFHSISLDEIEHDYNQYKEVLTTERYISALRFALKQDTINDFETAMTIFVEKQIEWANKQASSIQNEQENQGDNLPEWFKEQKNEKKEQQEESTDNEVDEIEKIKNKCDIELSRFRKYGTEKSLEWLKSNKSVLDKNGLLTADDLELIQ